MNYKYLFSLLAISTLVSSCLPWDLPDYCREQVPTSVSTVIEANQVSATVGGFNATWSLENSAGLTIISNFGSNFSFNPATLLKGNYVIKVTGQNSCGFKFDLSQVYVKANQLVVNNDIANVTAGSSVNIPVLANDLLNGAALQRSSISSPSIVLQPTKGTVLINPDGTLVYQANSNASGTDVFRYQVCLSGEPATCGVGEVGMTISPDLNSVFDIDGNKYNTVTIGSQVWLKENLKTTKYSNGDLIPNPNLTESSVWSNLTTGAWCYIDNNSANNLLYGKLYNFYVIEDSRKVCPAGWRVPTEEDWQTLERNLGMSESQIKEVGWRGTNEGSKLAGNASLWQNGELKSAVGFGNSGFDAIPSGFRYISGVYGFLRSATFLWSSTATDNENAWVRNIVNDNSGVLRYPDFKRTGRSIRCVKE
ncbi:MAG: FISUMP domain-containing protein [Spirosomataceae bacterium]